MNEWISVKDKFPNFDEECIVYTDDKNINVSRFYGFGTGFPDGIWEFYDGYYLDVTHWMPIPELPKED